MAQTNESVSVDPQYVINSLTNRISQLVQENAMQAALIAQQQVSINQLKQTCEKLEKMQTKETEIQSTAESVPAIDEKPKK